MDDFQPLAQRELPFGHTHSRFLVATLEEMLKEVKITPKQLGYVVTGVGPGSYTGIRVGVMVAKSLAYSCQIPLIGICTLAAFAPKQEGQFATIFDAKMSGVYLLKGKRENGRILFHSQPEICALTDLEKQLHHTDVLVTPHLDLLKPKVDLACPKNSWKWEESAPSAFHMRLLAQEAYSRGHYSLDGKVEIMYLRKTQAELEQKN